MTGINGAASGDSVVAHTGVRKLAYEVEQSQTLWRGSRFLAPAGIAGAGGSAAPIVEFESVRFGAAVSGSDMSGPDRDVGETSSGQTIINGT